MALRLVPVVILSALVGALAAFGLGALLDDDDGGGETRTVVRQAPLAAGGDRGGEGAGLTPAELYERLAPGVVFIRAEVVEQQVSPFGFPTERRGEATGSGFVTDDQGTILTNAHVVEGAANGRVRVTFADKKTVDARVRGTDISTDVAVLQVDPKEVDLTPLPLGSRRDVRVGDPVIAIGNPFGLDRTLTTGVVSALQREIRAQNNFTIEDVIQTDAAINPGNSGGPLIDAAGRVVGINTQILTGGPGSQGNVGIGFAVPIDTARRVAGELRESGRVDRGYLGVDTLTIDENLGGLNLPADRGVLVQSVGEGSPAAKAGLRAGRITAQLDGAPIVLGGDIITAVDGRPIRTSEELRDRIAGKKSGTKVKLTIVRDGDEREVEVQLGQRPDEGG
jgi:S1-C subfamily serine protease